MSACLDEPNVGYCFEKCVKTGSYGHVPSPLGGGKGKAGGGD